MKINNSEKTFFSSLTKKYWSKNKKTIVRILLLFILISFFVFKHFADKKLQAKGYTGLWEFVKTISSNYYNSMHANPEIISIEIKDKDYKILEKNRERAIKRNLIINNLDGDYVPATLEYLGKKMKVKLRLKGHMTDHLQDNKWSFRIKVKGKDSFMGMKLFSIQHPGTRGYIYEWIYHELMKQENIIALRYKFIDVTVNGRNWGIYAVEENFNEELISNNNRIAAPIIRFNPDLYWVNRYNMLKGCATADEFATYYSANPEGYNEKEILNDTIQKQYLLKALALVEGLRNNKLTVDEIFDIDRLAKFHAIIDLVGGIHSIDWSDIKYYYNPVTGKLEPIAYESFTDFNTREIAGNFKFVKLDTYKFFEDWHSTLFSNQKFFSAYVEQLQRVSQQTYLDNFFSSCDKSLTENLNIINKEFPYKKFDKQGYYRNQKMITQILSPPEAIHAYFSKIKDGNIVLQIGCIESLPVEIHSLCINKQKLEPLQTIVFAAKQRDEFVNYKEISFPIPNQFHWNDSLQSLLKINYSILGSSTRQQTKVFPYPHTDTGFIKVDLKNKKGNINEFSFLTIDEKNKIIYFKNGITLIKNDLIIPAGYKVIATGNLTLDMINYSKIISYSPLYFIGNEDEKINIESSDKTSQGIEIINSSISKFQYVSCSNFSKINDTEWKRSGAFTCYESSVEFKNCIFQNCQAEDAINIIRSTCLFSECLFENMKNDALDLDFTEGDITNCVFESCNENAIDATMSKIKLNSITVNGANKALNIKDGSQINGKSIRIKNSTIGISLEDQSYSNLSQVEISYSDIGAVTYQNKPTAGHPTLILSNASFNKVKTNLLKEKNSSINYNGKEIKEEVENAEKIIRNEKK